MKTSIQRGLTLVELMLVVAALGILAALALPAYQGYAVRAKVAENIVLARGLKRASSEGHLSKSAADTRCTTAADCGNIGAALAAPTANTVSVTSTADGAIAIAYKAAHGANKVLVAGSRDGLPAAPVTLALDAASAGDHHTRHARAAKLPLN